MDVLLECSVDTKEIQGKCIYPVCWLKLQFEGCLELVMESLDEAIGTGMVSCCVNAL